MESADSYNPCRLCHDDSAEGHGTKRNIRVQRPSSEGFNIENYAVGICQRDVRMAVTLVAVATKSVHGLILCC